jgi:uncharacterized membrane protein
MDESWLLRCQVYLRCLAPLAFVQSELADANSLDDESVRQAFEIAGEGRYDDALRFGLVVLSEIAGRLCHLR